MAQAFNNQEVMRSGNTQVNINGKRNIYLHGNLIAKIEGGALMVTLAGWNSNTTRERLNGLDGVRVSTRKGQAYLNGKAWGGEWVTVSEWDAQA